MSQVTIYLENTQAEQIKRAARSCKKSVSKWISEVVSEKLDKTWSEELKVAAGSWTDFPDTKGLRSSLGKDVKRESF